ncbi:MAG: pyruvate formate lyase-activating protein [Clostridia bacterium]|nr:pyruvate formate lyase-activating protein [Clostridia bacterium]
MYGIVHSRESFGTVDGPGVRYVLFLGGCPLRCLYCHNPDTWTGEGCERVEAEEIIREYKKNKAFYRNGGITVTGGEPLLQLDFLIELFALAKKEGIHTCIDTSGAVFDRDNRVQTEKLERLLGFTDLIMLDIKHIDGEKHKILTGKGNENILEFARFLDARGKDVWIRHVVVEGYTDDENDLFALGEFIGELKTVKALDVLPYHTLGVAKYDTLGINYPLRDTPSCSKEKAAWARGKIMDGLAKKRKNK